MKKMFTMAALALGLLAATPASAQVKFGLKAGLNLTNMSFDNELFDAKNQTGFFVGPTVKFSLPLVGLGIDASALYDQRSAKVTDVTAEEQTVKQQQLAIPINVRYGVGLGSLASGFIFAGPQFAFNLGDDEVKWHDQSNYALKKSNLSINVGLGVTLIKHLQVTANYNIACGKTADATEFGTIANVAGQATGLKAKSRSNAWQIAAAYYF